MAGVTDKRIKSFHYLKRNISNYVTDKFIPQLLLLDTQNFKALNLGEIMFVIALKKYTEGWRNWCLL